MTDGIHEGFGLPSESDVQFDPTPAIVQLRGRLLVVRGTKVVTVKNINASQPGQPPKVEKLQAEVAFLDGAEIGVLLDKHGQIKKQLDPPMRPGETRTMLVGGWFKQRSPEDKMANPGWPGLCGVLGTEDIGNGQTMWRLFDPSPEQQQQAAKWLAWKRQQDAQKAAQNPMQRATATPPAATAPVPQAAPAAPFPAAEQAAPAGATAPPPWA